MKTSSSRYDRQVAAARYWLMGMAQHDPAYFGVIRAMEFSKAHHNGKRNGGGPEFMHQIEIFHNLRTLHPFHRDPVITYILAFFHDIVEDGQKQADGTKKFVTLQQIADGWGEQIAHLVSLLSKEIEDVKNPEYSLKTIFTNEYTALVKLADRSNNISTMMGVFKRERALRYITETVEEFLPLAKEARRMFPEQEGAFENLKMQLVFQLNLIDLMMPTYKLDEDVVKSSKDLWPALEGGEPETDEPSTQKPNHHVSAIVCVDAVTGAIGYSSGELYWKCKEDMDFFRAFTMGKTVVMGRATFEDIGYDKEGNLKYDPLPGRDMVVISDSYLEGRSGNCKVTFVKHGGDFKNAIERIKDRFGDICIIGGRTVYQDCITHDLVDEWYINTITSSTLPNHPTEGVSLVTFPDAVFQYSNLYKAGEPAFKKQQVLVKDCTGNMHNASLQSLTYIKKV